VLAFLAWLRLDRGNCDVFSRLAFSAATASEDRFDAAVRLTFLAALLSLAAT
jgi:hypothetical protein